MRALDIPPHPRSSSRLAVAVLALISAGALAAGYFRQVVADRPQPLAIGAASAPIAEATPAPEPALQMAEAPHRARTAAGVSSDLPAEIAQPSAAEAVPAADASAVTAEPSRAAAQPPAPNSDEPMT